jgi:hypothetical protein
MRVEAKSMVLFGGFVTCCFVLDHREFLFLSDLRFHVLRELISRVFDIISDVAFFSNRRNNRGEASNLSVLCKRRQSRAI